MAGHLRGTREAPGGDRETIGTQRAFLQACMLRSIYWNRKGRGMFWKTRSLGVLGESEKKRGRRRGLRNLVAEGLPERVARSRTCRRSSSP